MKNLKLDIPKIIAYILVPILTLVIILNIVVIIICEYDSEDFRNGYKGYENTNIFANECFSKIMRAINIVDSEIKIIEEEAKGVVMYESSDLVVQTQKTYDESAKDSKTSKIQYNFYTIPDYDVLVITPDDIYVTNVEKTLNTDTEEKIKDYILSRKYFWKYDGTVETSIGKLSYEELVYHGLETIQDSGYQIYIALKDENNTKFNTYKIAYDFASSRYERAPYVATICSILLIANCLYIIKTIGHKKQEEGIYTNELDKIPYEVVGIVTSLLLVFEFFLLWIFVERLANMTQIMINTSIMITIFLGFVIYATLITAIVTTIRRIKAHIFWKNTIIYKICKFAFDGIFDNLNQTVKLALQYGGFIAVSLIITLIALSDGMNLILFGALIIFWYYIFKKMLDYINKLGKVREHIRNMYNGNTESVLDESELYGELKQVAKELNDISGGLSNAIEEATKSERLKTELITNVSHDIKTPLTSIINYVDLMKQEKIKDPKIQEYLEVLDAKSQRLKKLTEDLVEASKASSGNIKLTMENLNVKELIKQVGGEFEDRLKGRGLEVIESFPEEEISILADSRYMYRVMENMYVNIAKYALENSRVYVDVTKTNKRIQIALKNISEDKLNITVDELMERFTRGDVSRTTEGSGLGISIAKSLVELQNGKFDIYLDGDLFKVVIEFESIEDN